MGKLAGVEDEGEGVTRSSWSGREGDIARGLGAESGAPRL